MVLAFPGLTLGMLWERLAVIDIWQYSRLPYTGASISVFVMCLFLRPGLYRNF
ncbi:hypothetical protein Gogos_015130 [Gossypium gossypioides]|uniref:Uncharacterized protein n=1 Tax=Gossypium gossypioides TaxID=34282 RepID=A0A7J9C0L4_GOSGO|nr:hypothetical protein [Gossypium gossypioides]